MTSFKKVILLLCASTVFASVENNVLEGCKDSFPSFEKYILKDSEYYTHEDIDSFCNVFNTKKSKKFYNNPIESVCYNYFLNNDYEESDFNYEQLKESGVLRNYELISSLEVKYNLGNLLCFEHNQYNNFYKKECPYFYNLIKNGFENIYDKSYFNDIKYKICRSKDCLNNVVPFYESLLSSYKNKEPVRYDFRIISKNEAETVQDFINFLKSDKCVNYESSLYDGYNEKCGQGYGFCNESSIYSCCGKNGRCGYGEDYCEKRNGCNSDYGICVSADYYCGPKNYYLVCQANECCGENGKCGTGEEYCGTKCQSEFGECYSKSSKEEVEKKQSKYIKLTGDGSEKCGPGIGRCGEFSCCNKDGKCVRENDRDDSQCQVKNGCQVNYGICYNKVEPPTTKTNRTENYFLYNRYYNKCLYPETTLNERVTYEVCKDSIKYKWFMEKIDDNLYIKSAKKENFCLKFNKSKIVMGDCDEKAVVKYNRKTKLITLGNKCVSGIDDNDDPDSQFYVRLSSCDRNNEKQLWLLKYEMEDILNA